jgi:predicted transcriptional regulator
VHVFSAAIDREALIEQRLRDVSVSLCDGAVIPMLSGLIRMRRWTADEQQQLKKLLNDVSDVQDPGEMT